MRKVTPDVWGGPMWRTMHVVALGYPSNPSADTRASYLAFYHSLKRVIPCVTCRQGYVSILEDLPVEEALANPADLFNWTVAVHNRVNEKLGKLPMTAEYVRNTYIFEDGSPAAAEAAGRGGDGGVDPAVDRSNLVGTAVYGVAFAAMATLAWLVYLLFRPARPA